MTENELAEMEARAKPAVPGYLRAAFRQQDTATPTGMFAAVEREGGTAPGLVAVFHLKPDADFFTAARADISALIAEVRRLKKLVGETP